MEVSLTLSSPLDHGRTLGREKPMTFGDTAPTSFPGLHQFQSVGSNALQIISSKCSNSHSGPRPLKTISAHTFGCSGGNKFDNQAQKKIERLIENDWKIYCTGTFICNLHVLKKRFRLQYKYRSKNNFFVYRNWTSPHLIHTFSTALFTRVNVLCLVSVD